MSEGNQVNRLLELVQGLRNQIHGQQGSTSSPNKQFKGDNKQCKGDSFPEKFQALIELQNKLGYKFKNEGLLKRALDLFSERWETEHSIFKMLGKSVMQTCAYYRLVKQNPRISKGELQNSLNDFFGGREYGKESRGLGLEAFVRDPSANCRCNKKLNEIECLYVAVVGAIAVDSTIENATCIFLGLSKWNP